MKKVYSKPEIMFESFAASTDIAAGCEAKTNTPNNLDGCGYKPEGVTYSIFMTGMHGCDREYGDGAYNGICYHVPTENNNLFNS